MTNNIITKHLKYEFTDGEMRANGRELARQNQLLVEAELKRKQVVSDLKADEQRITSDIARLSRWVNDGHDFRPVECRIEFNDPKDGIKSFYRMDTGELVESISMEAHEMQSNLPLDEPEEDDDENESQEGESDGSRRPY